MHHTQELFNLTGKIALVTGASRGIGLSAALALAESGADLAISSRNKTDLMKVAEQIRKFGRETLIVPADVSDQQQVTGMVGEVIESFGKIDILVNSAGTIDRKPAGQWKIEEWNQVVNVNLTGTFLCCQEAGRHMIERNEGGKIINIASLSSALGIPNVIAYSSSKGGVSSLTRSLAVEWAKHKINVNAIGPGYIRTELTRALQDDQKRSAYITSRIPMGRWGEPSDLTGTVVFLASPASDYITGQMIWVDGGWTAA